MERKIKVTIKGNGIDYSSEIHPELAGKLINLCLMNQVVGGSNSMENSSVITPTKQSVAEYVQTKMPKRNPDKILSIAGYLAENGRENFSAEDIKPYFAKIAEPLPANFGRDFRWVVANGWLAEGISDPNQFYITNTGRRVLQSNFAKEVIEGTNQKLKVKSRKKHGNQKKSSGE